MLKKTDAEEAVIQPQSAASGHRVQKARAEQARVAKEEAAHLAIIKSQEEKKKQRNKRIVTNQQTK